MRVQYLDFTQGHLIEIQRQGLRDEWLVLGVKGDTPRLRGFLRFLLDEGLEALQAGGALRERLLA